MGAGRAGKGWDSMDSCDAMREIVARSGMSYRAVSEGMGHYPTWLSSTLHKNVSSKADTLASLCDVCGYALAAMPRADVPDGAIVIDPAEGAQG